MQAASWEWPLKRVNSKDMLKSYLWIKWAIFIIKKKFISFSVNYIGFEPGSTRAPRHISVYCCRYLLIIMVCTVTWGMLFLFNLWKYSNVFFLYFPNNISEFLIIIFILYICIISIIPVSSIALALLCIVWTLYCFYLQILSCLSSICGLTNKKKCRSLFSAALVKCLCCIFMQPENRAGDYKSFPYK